MCRHKYPFKITYLLILAVIFIFIFFQISHSTEIVLHHNPQSYVLNKFQSQDIVFLGTRHNQPSILKFISDLIPKLHESGVTHIGFEIASDQQDKIDRFINTGTGLNDIQIHPQIDCAEYRNLFKVLRALESKKRPTPIALDLPKSRYGGKISRDEWMAESIASVFESNPNSQILVVVGNNHILKKLDWQDHVVNKHGSIRQYITKIRRKLRIASIGQIIGESVYEDHFRQQFSPIAGNVAMDLDKRFAGWKLGIVESVAIKPAEVWELLDGVIVY